MKYYSNKASIVLKQNDYFNEGWSWADDIGLNSIITIKKTNNNNNKKKDTWVFEPMVIPVSKKKNPTLL